MFHSDNFEKEQNNYEYIQNGLELNSTPIFVDELAFVDRHFTFYLLE